MMVEELEGFDSVEEAVDFAGKGILWVTDEESGRVYCYKRDGEVGYYDERSSFVGRGRGVRWPVYKFNKYAGTVGSERAARDFLRRM